MNLRNIPDNNYSDDYTDLELYINSIKFIYKEEEIKYSKVISILENKFGKICYPKSISIIKEDCLRPYEYEILDYHPIELRKLKIPFPLLCFLRESHDRTNNPYFYLGKKLKLNLIIMTYSLFNFNNFFIRENKYSNLYVIKSFLVFTNYVINNVKRTHISTKEKYNKYISRIYNQFPIFKSKLISYFNFNNRNFDTFKFYLKPLYNLREFGKIIFEYAFKFELIMEIKGKLKENMIIFDCLYDSLYIDKHKRNLINIRLQLEYMEYRSDIYNEKKLLDYIDFLDIIRIY